MTISALAKNEIAVMPVSECCRMAVLSAIIHTTAALSFSKKGMAVVATIENTAVFNLFCNLSGVLYGKKAHTDGTKISLMGDDIVQILTDLGILKMGKEICLEAGINRFLVESECCKRAYLKGVFLGCGYLANPKNGYNLEFIFSSEELRDDVKRLCAYFELKSGVTIKDYRHKLYLKDKESISDLLALMGAGKAVLQLNSLAAERDIKRTLSRKANCDLANIDRSLDASMRQIAAIKGLGSGLKDKKLLMTAKIRLDNPEASYEELAQLLNISKSAVKYRLNKIVELFEKG